MRFQIDRYLPDLRRHRNRVALTLCADQQLRGLARFGFVLLFDVPGLIATLCMAKCYSSGNRQLE